MLSFSPKVIQYSISHCFLFQLLSPELDFRKNRQYWCQSNLSIFRKPGFAGPLILSGSFLCKIVLYSWKNAMNFDQPPFLGKSVGLAPNPRFYLVFWPIFHSCRAHAFSQYWHPHKYIWTSARPWGEVCGYGSSPSPFFRKEPGAFESAFYFCFFENPGLPFAPRFSAVSRFACGSKTRLISVE